MRSTEMNAKLLGGREGGRGGGGFKHLLFLTTGNTIYTGGNVVSRTVTSIASVLYVFIVHSTSSIDV
jgi:hypothetical protein